jgi:fructosamine-3-kinase
LAEPQLDRAALAKALGRQIRAVRPVGGGDHRTALRVETDAGPVFVKCAQAPVDTWPLDPGAAARSTLYNLYHVLNHFNLFGGGYYARAQCMIDELLATLSA